MKKSILLLLMAAAFGCKSPKAASTAANPEPVKETASTPKTAKTAEGDLLNEGSVQDLFADPYRAWFTSGYENYKPDVATVTKLRDLTNGISVRIFMGTWCEDSQNQVPKFFKIAHEAGFDKEDVTLIFVSKEKTTPEKLESGLNITNVPTFIFYKTTVSGARRNSKEKREEKTKELNRIVESPRETLEKDMLRILSNESYKHSYQN